MTNFTEKEYKTYMGFLYAIANEGNLEKNLKNYFDLEIWIKENNIDQKKLASMDKRLLEKL